MTESPNPGNDKQTSTTRREFLKIASVAAGALALGGDTRLGSAERKTFDSDVVMLDFFGSDADFENKAGQLLGVEYSSAKLASKIGVTGNLTDTDWGKKFYNYIRTNPEDTETLKIGLIYGARERLMDHGDDVTDTFNQILRNELGISVSENLKKSILDFTKEVSIEKDDLGNYILALELDTDGIIDVLKSADFQNVTTVNCSFMLGKVRVKIVLFEKEYSETNGPDHPDNLYQKILIPVQEGNKTLYVTGYSLKSDPSIHITGEEYVKLDNEYREKNSVIVETDEPYSKEIEPLYRGASEEEQNSTFEQIHKACFACPEKIFVMAAGNNDSDWRRLKERFSDRWPPNLIVVGFATEVSSGKYKNDYSAWGADVYIPVKNYVDKSGSSHAVPIVAAALQKIRTENENYSTGDLIRYLKGSCEDATSDEFNGKDFVPVKIKVLNMNLVRGI